MRSVPLLAALLMALLAVPGAWAAQGDVDVTARLPLTFEGAHDASGHGAFLLEGDEGRASLLVAGQSGTLTRVIHRAYGFVDPGSPSLHVTWAEEFDEERIPLKDAFLRLEERRPGFLLLVHDGDVELADRSGAVHVGALATPKDVRSDVARDLAIRVDPPQDPPVFQHTLAAGMQQARSTEGHAAASGAQKLFLGDAVLRLDPAEGETRELRAHFRIEQRPGTVYDPIQGSWTGPGSHQEYIQEHLVLEFEGRTDLQFDGTPGLLYTERLSLAGEGTARLPGAVGAVTVEDGEQTTRHALAGEDLVLGGRYTLQAHEPSLDRSRTHVTGEGDFTEVHYGAVAAEYDWTASLVVAAGLGTLVLAGLALLTSHGKAALAPIGGLFLAGYARVQGEEILEHPGRAQVYELVKAHPGAHFQQLSDKLPFGASTLNYHVRVLERNGYLTRVKDGRYVRFFDRQSGRYASHRKHAVSALRNPTTAAIARAVLERPGIAQCDLAERFGIAASTVNWHIRRLMQAGLVDKQRDHHYTRYYMGEAWASIPHDEQTRIGLAVAVA